MPIIAMYDNQGNFKYIDDGRPTDSPEHYTTYQPGEAPPEIKALMRPDIDTTAPFGNVNPTELYRGDYDVPTKAQAKPKGGSGSQGTTTRPNAPQTPSVAPTDKSGWGAFIPDFGGGQNPVHSRAIAQPSGRPPLPPLGNSPHPGAGSRAGAGLDGAGEVSVGNFGTKSPPLPPSAAYQAPNSGGFGVPTAPWGQGGGLTHPPMGLNGLTYPTASGQFEPSQPTGPQYPMSPLTPLGMGMNSGQYPTPTWGATGQPPSSPTYNMYTPGAIHSPAPMNPQIQQTMPPVSTSVPQVAPSQTASGSTVVSPQGELWRGGSMPSYMGHPMSGSGTVTIQGGPGMMPTVTGAGETIPPGTTYFDNVLKIWRVK